jgi:cytochrome P450 family 6
MILAWLSWIVSVATLILSFIYLYGKWKYLYWLRRDIPFLEPIFPYGNLKDVAVKIHTTEVYRKAYNELKSGAKLVGIYFYFKPIAVITDLDLARRILIKDFDIFPNRAFYYNEKHDPLSAHLVNVENKRWKSLRSKLSPTFTSGKLKMMFKLISNVMENLVVKIGKDISTEESLNMKDLFGRLATDVIASCAFGLDCDSLNDQNSEFFKMGQKAFEMKDIVSRVLRFGFPNLARKLGVRLFDKNMTDFYEGITRSTIEHRDKNNVERNDFMNLLIKMKNSAGNDSLSFEEIAAQSLIFYVAGNS